MAHSSGIESAYGGQKKMEEKLVEAMKKVYPLICLNDNNKAGTSVGGRVLSDADWAKLMKLLSRADDNEKIYGLLESGELKYVPKKKDANG
jgi:hypothetical protein